MPAWLQAELRLLKQIQGVVLLGKWRLMLYARCPSLLHMIGDRQSLDTGSFTRHRMKILLVALFLPSQHAKYPNRQTDPGNVCPNLAKSQGRTAVKILPLDEAECSSWGGGSTAELLILPAGSSYSERNFDYRISLASIDQPGSAFTFLPGIDRLITGLDGILDLEVNGKPVSLWQGQVLAFRGEDAVFSSLRRPRS